MQLEYYDLSNPTVHECDDISILSSHDEHVSPVQRSTAKHSRDALRPFHFQSGESRVSRLSPRPLSTLQLDVLVGTDRSSGIRR
jgi:hypothetical protein